MPGSEIGLRLLGQILDVDAYHVAPAYGTHAVTFRRARAMAFESLEETARHPGATILLGNPNNPDGRRSNADQLLETARTLAENGGRLIVDEAFADTADHASLAPLIGSGLPIILFRSFGKFFGLAGIRLGFVIASGDIVAAYRRLLGDWPISSAAIAIGTAAYRDGDWIAAMRRRLAADADAPDTLIARHGFAATGGCVPCSA